MIIQLNADKNLTIHADYESQINEKIKKELERFSSFISRIEVHFSDENGSKSGQDDKRCLLEVRLEGRSPVAVTNIGQTYDVALAGALSKAESAIHTIVSKLKAH